MLNTDPVNPVWGPICPWDPRYGRFGGDWGPFVGRGPVLSVRDPTDPKISDPPKIEESLEKKKFVAVSINVFPPKTERCFFFFGPWCTLQGLCALKRLGRPRPEMGHKR